MDEVRVQPSNKAPQVPDRRDQVIGVERINGYSALFELFLKTTVHALEARKLCLHSQAVQRHHELSHRAASSPSPVESRDDKEHPQMNGLSGGHLPGRVLAAR